LAGCTPAGRPPATSAVIPPIGPRESVTLTYWSWLEGLQDVCDIWNARNPRVQVRTAWIPGGTVGGYSKLHAALAAGGGPDIAQIEMLNLPEFILQGSLVDLAQYGAHDVSDRYDQAIWSQVQFLDGVYGIPQDSGPVGFYYRADRLEAVGAEPPRTWDEWAQIAKAIREDDADSYLECVPSADGTPFISYCQQAGARWFEPQGDEWLVSMTDDATLSVARFFDRAIDDDLVDTRFDVFSPAWFAAAADGRIAAATAASWADRTIEGVRDGAGKWRVAPMQTWGDRGFGSSYLGGSTAAVMTSSAHPQEAFDFVTWMTTDPEAIDAQIEHCGIGWSTSRDHIGTSREKPSEFFSGQEYNREVFLPAASEQNTDWVWPPIMVRTLAMVADAFRAKLSAGVPLVDSIAAAERRTVQAFRDAGLDARRRS